MEDFIIKYQTLIGAFIGPFLAVLTSLFLWYLKEVFEKKKTVAQNKKEVTSIFLMSARDSEEAVRDMNFILHNLQDDAANMIDVNDILLCTSPKLNKVYISEDRLTALKQGLDFITQQQIDIAITASKKFNGYMEQFEEMPSYILDSSTKLSQMLSLSKDEILTTYKEHTTTLLEHFQKIMETHIITAQINLLRPAVVSENEELKNNLFKVGTQKIDKIIELNASALLQSIKSDLN